MLRLVKIDVDLHFLLTGVAENVKYLLIVDISASIGALLDNRARFVLIPQKRVYMSEEFCGDLLFAVLNPSVQLLDR